MDLAAIISIPSSSLFSKLEVFKGELIYVKDGPQFKELVNKLLGPNKSSIEVLGESTAGLNGKALATLRKRIAYISNELYLFEEETAIENVKNYLNSAKISIPADLDSLLGKVALDPNTKVAQLTEMQKYQLRLIIGLAKKPELIIVDNPYSQLDEAVYNSSMGHFYKLITEKGITFITSYANEQIMAKFPGRQITL